MFPIQFQRWRLLTTTSQVSAQKCIVNVFTNLHKNTGAQWNYAAESDMQEIHADAESKTGSIAYTGQQEDIGLFTVNGEISLASLPTSRPHVTHL